jgi:hypothetical protein
MKEDEIGRTCSTNVEQWNECRTLKGKKERKKERTL